MGLIDFVKKEELENFMAGVVVQMKMADITEEDVAVASEQMTKFKDVYDEIEKAHGNTVAGHYAATYIAVMLLIMSSSGIDEISVIPEE